MSRVLIGPQGEVIPVELPKRAEREKKAPAREKRISPGPARLGFGPQGEIIPVPEKK